MLFLLFNIEADRYAIPANLVDRVIPMLRPKELPFAAPGIMGLIEYQGEPLPLLDTGVLSGRSRVPQRLSSRIIVLKRGLLECPLALLASQVNQTINIQEDQWKPSPVKLPEQASFLGPLFHCVHGVIQRIEVRQLIPLEVQKQLRADSAPSTHVVS